MDREEAEGIYRQAGLEWCQKDDRCEFVSADRKGVKYKFNGYLTRVHPWELGDWEVFTPPSDILMSE